MSMIIVKPLKKSVCTWLCKQRVRKGYEIMSDWEKAFEDLANKETVTLTKGEIKSLMKEAAAEAVKVEREQQKQENTTTKEQIMQIKDRTERQAMIQKHKDLFR